LGDYFFNDVTERFLSYFTGFYYYLVFLVCDSFFLGDYFCYFLGEEEDLSVLGFCFDFGGYFSYYSLGYSYLFFLLSY